MDFGGSMSALFNQQYLDAASAAITPQRPLLESLREINQRLLYTLRDAARAQRYRANPDLGSVAPLFESLSSEAIEQAARFPFLLMDLGLSGAGPCGLPEALATPHNAIGDGGADAHWQVHVALARSALVVAWHATQTDSGAALLLFGISPQVAEALSALPLHTLESLAPACVSPLTLRWRRDRRLWRQLLNPAAYDSVDTVRGFVMQAVQLTATPHLRLP